MAPQPAPRNLEEMRERLQVDERKVVDIIWAVHGKTKQALGFALIEVHPFVRRMFARFRTITQKDKKPSPERARALQEVANALISESTAGMTMACGKGCSHCCRNMPIHVVEEEGMALARALNAKDEAERARLLRRAQTLPRTSEPNTECVFLSDEGACTAYEDRPAPCRTYHSTDADRCEARMRDGLNVAENTVLAFPSDSAVLYTQFVVTGAGDTAFVYEMNSFIKRLLENPDHRAAWARGEALDESDIAVKPPGNERARVRRRIPLVVVG